jgi:hypothetical protein
MSAPVQPDDRGHTSTRRPPHHRRDQRADRSSPALQHGQHRHTGGGVIASGEASNAGLTLKLIRTDRPTGVAATRSRADRRTLEDVPHPHAIQKRQLSRRRPLRQTNRQPLDLALPHRALDDSHHR